MGFSTECLKLGPYASYDIKVTKEDQLYRTALAFSIKDMIESYNFFITNNLRGILIGNFTTTDGTIINVKDVEVRFPQFTSEDGNFWMTPFISRQTGSSFMCDVIIHYKETKQIHGQHFNANGQQMTNAILVDNKIKSRKIGSFHCLAGSCRDITTIKPPNFNSVDEWKAFLGECPASPGCFTLNVGNEKIIAGDKKLRTNIKVTYMTKDDTPLIESRITCMDNSRTTLVRMQIGKNLPNVKIIFPHLKGRHYPLYLVFYLVYYAYCNNVTDNTEFSIGRFAPLIASFAPNEERDRIIAYLKSSRIKFEALFMTFDDQTKTYKPDFDKIRKYIHNKMGKPKSSNSEINSEKYVLITVAQDVPNELYIQCKTFREKIANLCDLTCQTIRCAIGTRAIDSRDKLSNIKADSFIRMLAHYATDTLVEQIKNNSVDSKGFNYGKSDRKEVIVEARKTETLNASIADTRKIVNRVDQRTNSITLREVSQDTFPNICPAKTPEGVTCGLNGQTSALCHTSDNQEYNPNRRTAIDDLFEPYIQYISNIKTDKFKYQLITINPNGQPFLPLYGLNVQNVTDQIFVSSRIINCFQQLLDENKLIYYIDDESIIYVRFNLPCYEYSFKTFMGGILYTVIPTELAGKFSEISNKIRNPDYKFTSSIIQHEDCQMTLGFNTNEDQNIMTVTVVNSDGKTSFLNISDYFIELLKIILGKNDKIKIIKQESGQYSCIVTCENKLSYFDFLHWSGIQIACMIPSYLKRNFGILLGIINEYLSTEKSKSYSSSFNFNGNVIIDPNTTGFYPKIIWVNGKKVVNYIRNKRRIGELPYDSFASHEEQDMAVGYFDDPGRLMSPLLIVNDDGDLIIDKLDSWKRFNNYDFDNSKSLIKSLYTEGSLELIDAREMDSVLVAIDIKECRNINKLRKFLNNLDLDILPSSIFETKDNNIPTGYYRNEDIMSIKINGNSYDVEFSLIPPNHETMMFEENNITYYGNYIINRKIYQKNKKRIFKLIPPEDSILRDGYHMLFFDDEPKFITESLDPEHDDESIFLPNSEGTEMLEYKILYLDFNKSKDIYVDKNCTVIEIKKFTRNINDSNEVFVLDGKIINKSELTDDYFYIKDGKYNIPDLYIFPEDEFETFFEMKNEKIYRYIPEEYKNYQKYNNKIENSKELDDREAKLYIATIRRYIDDLDRIPDVYKPDDHFKILSLLKENITEFGIKRCTNTIRRYLNGGFKFTHCLIDPNQAYSFIANFVPKADSNPGPRFSYQCSMGVQAMGVGNLVLYRRYETLIKHLVAPTEHPFETVAELPLMQVMMPTTQNLVYLVNSNYKGFEDPIILTEEALMKFGRYEKGVTIKITETTSREFTEVVSYPMKSTGDLKSGHVYRHLDKKGLPILGSRIQVGDCIVGRSKVFTTSEGIKRNDSSFFSTIGTEGIVTAVQIVGSENNSSFRTIIIKLAQRRKQQAGDKMAARYSQKGTIGDVIGGMINNGDVRLKIVDSSLMPYVVSGPNKDMRAEIIFNPASFPSRMTCGLIKEVPSSKASLYLQEKVDATNFHYFDMEYYRNALWENELLIKDRYTNNKGNEIKLSDDVFISKNHFVSRINGKETIVTKEDSNTLKNKKVLINKGTFEIVNFIEGEHLDINGNEILAHSDGEIIMDSTTGKPMKFFLGIVAYQFLKHHTEDKKSARAKGSMRPITHQPDGGRSIGGGQKFGEMERDTLLSHGASAALFDRFMKASDGYVGVYCYKCKNDSSISQLKTKICQLCGTAGSLVTVDEPRIFKVFKSQMNAIGLNILETLRPVDDFQADIVRATKAELGMNTDEV